MINLIPNKEKKDKVKDFYFRLTVVSLMVFGFCVLVATASILPSYFLSSVKKNVIDTKLEMQKSEPLPAVDPSTLTVVTDLNSKLNLIENAEKNKYIVSLKIINEIIAEKMSDIKITQISYDNTTVGGKKISIRGEALSRDRLLLFRRALENNPAFKKVDLPISNFVKGADIQFSLSLIPA